MIWLLFAFPFTDWRLEDRHIAASGVWGSWSRFEFRWIFYGVLALRYEFTGYRVPRASFRWIRRHLVDRSAPKSNYPIDYFRFDSDTVTLEQWTCSAHFVVASPAKHHSSLIIFFSTLKKRLNDFPFDEKTLLERNEFSAKIEFFFCSFHYVRYVR